VTTSFYCTVNSILSRSFYVKKNNDRLSRACVQAKTDTKNLRGDRSYGTWYRTWVPVPGTSTVPTAVHPSESVRGNQLLGGLPWPMSDEFLNNNNDTYDRSLPDPRTDADAAELDAATELGDERAPQHHRAPARRIGELLVEAYGKAVPNKGRRPAPSIVLLEIAQFLVRAGNFAIRSFVGFRPSGRFCFLGQPCYKPSVPSLTHSCRRPPSCSLTGQSTSGGNEAEQPDRSESLARSFGGSPSSAFYIETGTEQRATPLATRVRCVCSGRCSEPLGKTGETVKGDTGG
jgi:hypothetical protein